ncbi:reverse transcriptase domain-containing protein [Paenibacillus terrae]|uniref:reverse transcriptase domain-containing protein n=1 Tax=Paenibacillus terrae TaxID=159743 RepID=UPI000698CC97|nr:reverse transcriptase domain-containing protein [Paenibacillus terrae]
MFVAEERIAYLSKLALEKKDLRFKDLYMLVYRVEFLEFAYSEIENNKGSMTAGIDSFTKHDLQTPEKRQSVLEELATSLFNKSYIPLPVRRIEIPKSNGKMRPLGIPVLYDRIIQSAVKLILEAIYEPVFLPVSHGFRPRHSCQTAINDVVNRTFDWVLEGDIQGCFDNIKHGRVLNLIRRRVADEDFVQLIAKFLKSGYQMGFGLDGKYPIFETNQGTPQGGIVSPVLANIYLHEFDKYISDKMQSSKLRSPEKVNPDYGFLRNKIHRIGKAIEKDSFPYSTLDLFSKDEGKRRFIVLNTRDEAIKLVRKLKVIKSKTPSVEKDELYANPKYKSFGYVRYADDFVITLGRFDKEYAKNLKTEITNWFRDNLELNLSPEKTLITHSTEGFKFLGYYVKQRKSENGHGFNDRFAQIYTPDDKKKSFIDKIDKVLRDNHNAPEFDVIVALNRVINGWSRYHQIANNWKTTANKLDHMIYWKVLHWIAWKRKSTIPSIMEKHYNRVPGYKDKRISTVLEISGKVAVLSKCYDHDYKSPKEVSDKVRKLNAVDEWMFSDKNDGDKEITGKLTQGSSMEEYLELHASQKGLCASCANELREGESSVHHIRKVNRTSRKTRTAVEQAARAIPKLLICNDCHHKETNRQRNN